LDEAGFGIVRLRFQLAYGSGRPAQRKEKVPFKFDIGTVYKAVYAQGLAPGQPIACFAALARDMVPGEPAGRNEAKCHLFQNV
jgi:hypothetical protein